MVKFKGGTSLAKLRGRIQSLHNSIGYEELLQELNPEDHPVQHETSSAEIKRSENRVLKKEAEIKALKRQIAKKSKGKKTIRIKGGGGGGMPNKSLLNSQRGIAKVMKNADKGFLN
tara:strand:- start:1314 stop:1661 length:348 start_codon:yes stop_codon:yes gene_type:complete